MTPTTLAALGISAVSLTLFSCYTSTQHRSPSEEEVRFQSGGAKIAGTLVLPGTPGPHPALVVVHGSGRLTRDRFRNVSSYFVPRDYAVLIYDKRGVGDSTGLYSGVNPANSHAMFGELASDALAGVALLASRRDIQRDAVGLLGFSQAGWIIPRAAAQSQAVRFAVIISGPTVSVGEEIYYSDLTGDDAGAPSTLSDEESPIVCADTGVLAVTTRSPISKR